MTQERPVPWAHMKLIHQYVLRVRPTLQPSILVNSLPGSGSSWVGETLGSASNAVYLREPISQPHFARGGAEAVFHVDASAPSAYLQDAADSFRALPRFPSNIVLQLKQWSLWQRRRRRLVVKEVNSLACEWLARHYQLRLVFLVRHPMAVAARAHRLGYWLGPELSVWREQGEFQARTLERAWAFLKNCADKCIVLYEDLCADPTGEFRALVEFAELAWDAHLERHIRTHTEGGDRALPYATTRASRSMLGTWRSEVNPERIEQFKAGFLSITVPWYQSESDW